jgi:hypothetical protein
MHAITSNDDANRLPSLNWKKYFAFVHTAPGGVFDIGTGVSKHARCTLAAFLITIEALP